MGYMNYDAPTAYPDDSGTETKRNTARQNGAQAEHLVIRYKWLVRMTARRFFPRQLQDQDLLQCGLIGLWEAARSWSGRGDFTAYARYSVLNNMKDHIRTVYKAAPPPAYGRRLKQAESCEDKIIDRLDTAARIKRSWPENSRERFVLLALMNGVSKQAVAAALGIQLHTLRRIAIKAMEGLEKGDNGQNG